MKLLAIADEESKALWDYYTPDKLQDVELIIACGDLNRNYLEYLTTMAPVPVVYVHGNHDEKYDIRPPEGALCIDDDVLLYRGLRIAGLGGSCRYRTGPWQFTEAEMKKRVRRLRSKIERYRGLDILVTHAPLHGHVHMNYGANIPREHQYGPTRIVNCFERVYLEAEPALLQPQRGLFQSLWRR